MLLTVTTTQTYAQDFYDDFNDESDFLDIQLKSGNTYDYVVDVALFALRSPSGQKYNWTSTLRQEMIDGLNYTYGSYGYTFNLVSYSYIDVTQAKWDSCLSQITPIDKYGVHHAKPNCLNITFANNLHSVNKDTGARDKVDGLGSISSGCCVIDYTAMTSTNRRKYLVSHESGHAMGLYHTFAGHPDTENAGYYCEEYVKNDISYEPNFPWKINGKYCGDKIMDTPADPSSWSSCAYNTAHGPDPFGRTYVPLADNVMSYNCSSVAKHITQGQADHISKWVSRNTELQLVLPISMTIGDSPHTITYINSSKYKTIQANTFAGQYGIPLMWQIKLNTIAGAVFQ